MLKTILIIDDEANMRHMLSTLLSKSGYKVEVAADGAEGLARIAQHDFDFILCDLKMPVMDGMTFLGKIQERRGPVTVIMMSAYGTVDQAIETVKQGAYDYISKPFKVEEILLVLRKAEERERLRRENVQLKEQLDAIDGQRSFGGMVGKSKAMQEVFQLAEKVAKYNTTILITGESGTGKELVARGIHQAGKGKGAPFVAVNCGGIPENLLESEFFGYVKGAFTGADKDKKGLFEEADQGTLFLDEIGELPLELQVKLLRVLQEQEVRRVGAVKSQAINVRVLAATNRDLVELVKQKAFREDLFYRLNVINIAIPPLRQHPEDIPLLCRFFLDKFIIRLGIEVQGVAPAAMDLFLNYQWPGNVRELENVLERSVILAEHHMIAPENLPKNLSGVFENRRLDDFLGTQSLKKAKVILEKRIISRVLADVKGNKSKAAAILEISYPSLLSKLKEYGIEDGSY
ncbi:MAG: sigma-54-dependent Fis family transcriptional regulator [Desulfobulbaceae bacterium]|nr:sigma-54-dependent Fis family transcriptional regulator [Desulfobulbaceae bacterium]